MKVTCDNLIEHQQIWAKNLHIFPDNYIPPIRVPKNFSVNDLKPNILQELEKSTLHMQRVSDELFKCKIPKNDYEKAAELLNGSFMQELLGTHR